MLYVDSKMRMGGLSDNSFSIDLRESLHLSDHGVRVDKLRIANNFFTTGLGRRIYYKHGAGLQYYAIPEQAYTGAQLAAVPQTATGRTTTYDPDTNAITQSITAAQEWLSDGVLRRQ